MKKFLLSLSLFGVSLLGYSLIATLTGDETVPTAAETEVEGNVLVNGSFSNPASLELQATEEYSNAVPEGKWMIMSNNTEKVNAEVVDGGEGHPTAVKFDETATLSWWLGYLMQNVEGGVKAQKYILSFDAKNVSGNKNLSTWIYVGGPAKLYAMKTGFDYTNIESQASGARYDRVLTTEWDHYEFEYDFEVLLDNINSPAARYNAGTPLQASEATAEQLKMVRVCINNNNKVGSFLIDNVALVPVGDDTGIDNVTVDSDENAPVEYYNLQGVRVENPANGHLYIKRQGNKAIKVIM